MVRDQIWDLMESPQNKPVIAILVLDDRLCDAIACLNPGLPTDYAVGKPLARRGKPHLAEYRTGLTPSTDLRLSRTEKTYLLLYLLHVLFGSLFRPQSSLT